MSTSIFIAQKIAPVYVIRPDDMSYIKEYELLKPNWEDEEDSTPCLDWGNDDAYRVLTALGLLPDPEMLHTQPPISTKVVIESCDHLLNRVHSIGSHWLEEFSIGQAPCTAAMFAEIASSGMDVIDCSEKLSVEGIIRRVRQLKKLARTAQERFGAQALIIVA